MARFIFLGELENPVVKEMGQTTELRIPTQKEGVKTYKPVPPATEFVPGKPLGYEFKDPTSIRCLQTDPRFKQET